MHQYALPFTYGKFFPRMGNRNINVFTIFDERDYTICPLDRLTVLVENIAILAPVVESIKTWRLGRKLA